MSANDASVADQQDTDSIRRSFIGSIKHHLSRKLSNSSTRDSRSPEPPRSPASATSATFTASYTPNADASAPPSGQNLTVPSRNLGASRAAGQEAGRDADDPPPPYEHMPSHPPASASRNASLAASYRRPASPSLSTTSGASRLTMRTVSTPEDPFAFLSTFDTVFVIDDSGSMAGRSWREVKTVLANITPICTSHDADGIDIYFLNHRTSVRRPGPGKTSGGYPNVRDAASVASIFDAVRPAAATPTGTRIDSILRPYLRNLEEKMQENPDEPDVKPMNMIVITDGVPTDDLERVLHVAAQRLDKLDAPPYQVGVQFFQVGNEPGASKYLSALDNNLNELVRGCGVRDIVDTVTWDARIRQSAGAGSSGRQRPNTSPALTADGILKAVLGAVIKRLDQVPTSPSAVGTSAMGQLHPGSGL